MLPPGTHEFLLMLKKWHLVSGDALLAVWHFRSDASGTDGRLSLRDRDIVQLSTAAFFFVSWLFLKPSQSLTD